MGWIIKSLYKADARGAVAIEYAIVLPVLLVLMLGIMDVGRLMWTYSTIARATQAAARCFAIKATSCATATETQNYAVTQVWGLTVDASTFTVSTPACGAQVSASYVFAFVVPWFDLASPFGSSNTMTLSVAACYSV